MKLLFKMVLQWLKEEKILLNYNEMNLKDIWGNKKTWFE
jgi:hypothetical protein